MPPRLSILITARNAAPYIGQCVDSLRRQTFIDWECLFTNDASDDDTYQEFIKAIGEDPRFVYIVNTPQRRTALPNLMDQVRAAMGEILVILDGDDYFRHDEALQRIVDCYADPEVDAVYGSYCCEPGGSYGHMRNPVFGKELAGWYYGHTLTGKRELFLQSFREEPESYIDAQTGDIYRTTYDVPLYLPVIYRARKIVWNADVGYAYRRYHDNRSGNDDATLEGAKDQKRCADQVFEFWRVKAGGRRLYP